MSIIALARGARSKGLARRLSVQSRSGSGWLDCPPFGMQRHLSGRGWASPLALANTGSIASWHCWTTGPVSVGRGFCLILDPGLAPGGGVRHGRGNDLAYIPAIRGCPFIILPIPSITPTYIHPHSLTNPACGCYSCGFVAFCAFWAWWLPAGGSGCACLEDWLS